MPGSGIAISYGKIIIIFLRNPILFSIVAAPIYILTKIVACLKVWGFLRSRLLSCDMNVLCVYIHLVHLVVPGGLGGQECPRETPSSFCLLCSD